MPEIRLRPLTDADVPVLARWAEDDVFRLAADWSDGTLAEHEAVFRHNIANPPAELLRLAAVHDGRLVGYIDLHGSAPRVRELGYLIGPSAAWGRGLGTAVARAGLAYGFAEVALAKIWAEALDANAASVRILQRLGMRETGRGQDATYRGEPTHYRQFIITAEEFFEQQGGKQRPSDRR